MRKEDFWGELRSALSEINCQLFALDNTELLSGDLYTKPRRILEQALESGLLSKEELKEVVAPYVREAMSRLGLEVWAAGSSLEKDDIRAALTTAICISVPKDLPYLDLVAAQVTKLAITDGLLRGIDKGAFPNLRYLDWKIKREGGPNLNPLALDKIKFLLPDKKPLCRREVYSLSWTYAYEVKHLILDAKNSGDHLFDNLQINPRVETLSLCSLAVVIDPKVNWQNLKELYVVEGLGLDIPEGFSLEKLCPELEVFCHLPSRASLFGDVYLKEWLSRKLPETLKVIITSEEDLPETSLCYQRLRRIRPDIRILRIDTTRRIPCHSRALYLAGLKQGIKLQGVAP